MTANVSADELDFVQIDRKRIERAVDALERAKCAGLRVVTAESCTGGLIATVLMKRPAPQNISTEVLSPTRLSKMLGSQA